MKFPYLLGRPRLTQPSFRAGVQRWRPIIPVRLTVVSGHTLDGLLDTGADDTVFPNWVAPFLGLDLSSLVDHPIHLAGRPQSFSAKFASVCLRVTDKTTETCEWTSTVGFAPIPLRHALLGYAAFLEFFEAGFHGADHEVTLSPNASFAGRHFVGRP